MAIQGDWLISRLIESLEAPSSLTRKNAAGALRLHGPRAAGAIPALSRLVATEADPRVRAEARRALRQLERIAG